MKVNEGHAATQIFMRGYSHKKASSQVYEKASVWGSTLVNNITQSSTWKTKRNIRKGEIRNSEIRNAKLRQKLRIRKLYENPAPEWLIIKNGGFHTAVKSHKPEVVLWHRHLKVHLFKNSNIGQL